MFDRVFAGRLLVWATRALFGFLALGVGGALLAYGPGASATLAMEVLGHWFIAVGAFRYQGQLHCPTGGAGRAQATSRRLAAGSPAAGEPAETQPGGRGVARRDEAPEACLSGQACSGWSSQ